MAPPSGFDNDGTTAVHSIAPLRNVKHEELPEQKSKRQEMAADKVAGKVSSPPSSSTQSTSVSYVAPPLVSRHVVWGFGLFLFGMAMIWPPLLLLVTYVASVLIPYSFRVNDDASTRRSLLHKFDREDDISAYRREIPEDVHIETDYWENSRGLLLHTTILTPKSGNIKAVVGFCHGYNDNPPHTKQREMTYLSQHDIAVVIIEYEGHGRSDGSLMLIPDWNQLTNDVHSYFQQISTKRFPDQKFFLMGESMGGAVAYSIVQKHPNAYAGVVFQCPMCKISDDMLPPDWVIELCQTIVEKASLLGYLPIAPAKGDLLGLAFKLPFKRTMLTRTPGVFGRQPRLATAKELINVTKQISSSLTGFNTPFLVQHGEEDRVTDPELSRALYKEAASKDKTIHLYKGMWHSLTGGEPDENVQRVMQDATDWILERAAGSTADNDDAAAALLSSSSSSSSSSSVSSLDDDTKKSQ